MRFILWAIVPEAMWLPMSVFFYCLTRPGLLRAALYRSAEALNWAIGKFKWLTLSEYKNPGKLINHEEINAKSCRLLPFVCFRPGPVCQRWLSRKQNRQKSIESIYGPAFRHVYPLGTGQPAWYRNRLVAQQHGCTG